MSFITFFKKKSYRWCALIAMLFAMLGTSSAFAATTTIVAKHSGKCLDVRGGVTATGNGAPIEQWTCSGQANQAWTLKDMGGAQYELIASNSNKCVDIFNGGTANGTAIQQMDCTGQPNQLWKVNSLGSGQYQIISTSSGRCLDVTGGPTATGDGVLTELWDCVPQATNQSWALTVPAATATATTQVISVHSGKCLDVTGGTAATGNGVPIEQWTCSGQSNEAWTVKDMGNGQYELIASNSGKCLDITNSSTVSGTPVQQMSCTGQPNQLWTLLSNAARQFQVISVLKSAQGNQNCLTIKKDSSGNQMTNDGAPIVSASCDYPGSADNSWTMDVALPIRYLSGNRDKCLDVRGGEQAIADGTLTEIWTCTGLKNQLWTIKDMGNKQYHFVASNSGKCLDLVGGGTSVGNKVQQSQCTNTPTQLWTTNNIGNGYTMIVSVAAAATGNSSGCLDIVGGYTAAADGVLTQLQNCTTQELWIIGTQAPFP
ncbi:MAG TPA: RICIN domain-containing protein [Burkholderiaceae bacterium]|jgi:hypothetical protein